MKLLVAALAPILVLAACASPERKTTPDQPRRERVVDQERQTGLWNLLDQARRDKQSRKPRTAIDAGAASLPRETREAVDRWWLAWRTDSDDLLSYREALEAKGPVARKIIAENLVRWYVMARDAGRIPEAERSFDELLRYRDEAIPILVYGLSQGLGDSALRNMLGELLGEFGEDSLPDIQRAIDDATPKGRLALARTLKLMTLPKTAPLLIDLTRPSYGFAVRIEALDGLRMLRTASAVAAFTRCLRDDDPSVRKFAARGAAAPGQPDRNLLAALTDCLERSLRSGERETARACAVSLAVLLGENHRFDVSGWRRAIKRRGS